MKEEIAQILRALRERAGLSQGQVAVYAPHVAQGTLSDWELGKIPQAWLALRSLATLYRVSADTILGRVEEELPEHVRELMVLASGLSSFRQYELRLIAQTFAENERAMPSPQRAAMIEMLLDAVGSEDAAIDKLLEAFAQGRAAAHDGALEEPAQQ